ncbi:hypothetical protein [Nonomuraea indica]|nr:hypothetical protein [Nonomuraea indica]
MLSVYRWYVGRRIAVADCRTVAQVRQYVDLADLVEVVTLPRR